MTRQEDRRTMEAMLAAIRDAIHQETALQVAGLNAASLPEEDQSQHITPADPAEHKSTSGNGPDTSSAAPEEPATGPSARQPASAPATAPTAPAIDDVLAEPLALEALLDESLQDLVAAEPENAVESHAPSDHAPSDDTRSAENNERGGSAASQTDEISPHTKASLQGARAVASHAAPFIPSRSSARFMTGKSGFSSSKSGFADILSGKAKAALSEKSSRFAQAEMPGKTDARINNAAEQADQPLAPSQSRRLSRLSATGAADDSWHTFSKSRRGSGADEDARLLDAASAQRARAAFDCLRRGHWQNENNTANVSPKVLAALDEEEIQTLVLKALRPMLRDWLNAHLPALVERLVREEIARIAHGASDKDQGRGA